MTAFTAREQARDVFAVARNMGRGRVMGADAAETAANRRRTWQRVIALIDRAVDTDRVSAREPDDQQLTQMRAGAQAEVDRIVAAEAARRDAQRARLDAELARELVEPTTTTIGPRTWFDATTGQFR